MSTLPAILGMCASLFGNFSQNPKPWQRVPGLPKSAAQAGQGLQGWMELCAWEVSICRWGRAETKGVFSGCAVAATPQALDLHLTTTHVTGSPFSTLRSHFSQHRGFRTGGSYQWMFLICEFSLLVKGTGSASSWQPYTHNTDRNQCFREMNPKQLALQTCLKADTSRRVRKGIRATRLWVPMEKRSGAVWGGYLCTVRNKITQSFHTKPQDFLSQLSVSLKYLHVTLKNSSCNIFGWKTACQNRTPN